MLFQPNPLLKFRQVFFEYAWSLYISWHNHDNVQRMSDKHKGLSGHYVPPLRIHRVIALKLYSPCLILDGYIQNPSNVFRLLLAFFLDKGNPLTKDPSFLPPAVFSLPSFSPAQLFL